MASGFYSSNISFYTIPIAWALALGPHVYAVQLYQKASSRHFDNTQPRSLTQMVAGNQSIDSATKGRIIRAESAQANGFENVGLFAAAVIAGNMANLEIRMLNLLSVGYLASRLIYNYIYINNTTGPLAMTRTAVFISGVGMIWTLFIMAGNTFRSLSQKI
jgi:uncharacterized MAPEG superfamily protein